MGFSHKKRIDWTLRDVTSDRSALKVITLKDFKGQCPIDQVFGLFGYGSFSLVIFFLQCQLCERRVVFLHKGPARSQYLIQLSKLYMHYALLTLLPLPSRYYVNSLFVLFLLSVYRICMRKCNLLKKLNL